MKIVQFIYGLHSGGAERFVVDMVNEMASQGHEVHLVTQVDSTYPEQQFNRQFVSPEVKLHDLGIPKGTSLKGIPRMMKLIHQIKPDVVHGHLNVIPYMMLPALYRRKTKYFHTLHSLAPACVKARLQYYFNKFYYRTGLIKAVAISSVCRESFVDFYHLQRVVQIDNGRAPVKATDKLAEVKAEVEALKKSADDKVFIHVGRCVKAKNQKLLVEAFNRLNEQGVNFTLIVIGAGFFDEYGAQFREAACDRIHFLGERHNVGDYMLCSDAFCLTSHFEGLPISLLEALSVGITPICTRAGGISDVIVDGVNGYLSKAIATDEYVEALHRFLDSPLQASVLRKSFADNYSMAICAKKHLDMYASALNK